MKDPVGIVCPGCHIEFAGTSCPNCGGVSAPDDSLDSMIQGASVPSLASLFRKAKERGVIGPVSVYGEGAPNTSN